MVIQESNHLKTGSRPLTELGRGQYRAASVLGSYGVDFQSHFFVLSRRVWFRCCR